VQRLGPFDTLKRVEESVEDDRVLAKAFLDSGDEDAFRELFRRHTPALHALALRLLGRSRAGTDDVVQETWLRAAARLGEFSWRSSLRTWLMGIVINCTREALRKEKPFAGSYDNSLDPPILPAGPDLDLERAVCSLADGYREVLVLHDVVGFTHEEIAERLGIEAGTSKSQLSRARQALRVLVEGGSRPPRGGKSL
jgi:RNA polymerase sigma factor (sigma-70 family)